MRAAQLGTGYAYHRSPRANFNSIKEFGLTSQHATAKNGVKFKWDINFASEPMDTDGYVDGDSLLLRVKISDLKDRTYDPFSGYIRTTVDVPPEHLQFQHKGRWIQL